MDGTRKKRMEVLQGKIIKKKKRSGDLLSITLLLLHDDDDEDDGNDDCDDCDDEDEDEDDDEKDAGERRQNDDGQQVSVSEPEPVPVLLPVSTAVNGGRTTTTTNILVDNSIEMQKICFVGAILRATGNTTICCKLHNNLNEVDDKNQIITTLWQATEIHLVRCAPDPNAVEFVISALAEKICADGSLLQSPLDAISIHSGRSSNSSVHISISVSSLLGNPKRDSLTEVELQRVHALIRASSHQNMTGRQRRLETAKQVRILNGATAQNVEKAPRQRVPRTKKADLELLERLEQMSAKNVSQSSDWHLFPISEPDHSLIAPPHDKMENDETNHRVLNLPEFKNDDPCPAVSCRGTMTRVDYIHGRKWPQVQWMVARLKHLQAQTHTIFRHILDVGGGRGDLGVAIAREFPDAIVTVIDKNHKSLEAGKEYSRRIGCSESMHFVQADFLSYVQENDADLTRSSISTSSDLVLPLMDVVVALHACGDLTDLVLEFAQRRNLPFLVCPCCFNKRWLEKRGFEPKWYQFCGSTATATATVTSNIDDSISALQRLAESEIRSVSFRAMSIINSMRMSLSAQQISDTDTGTDTTSCQSLEQYSSEYSLRNMVLVFQPN